MLWLQMDCESLPVRRRFSGLVPAACHVIVGMGPRYFLLSACLPVAEAVILW